ncbi:hypothetical protein KAU37_13525, partial [Candidatus Bipolaricaulota bacterium]|nr:hypothetical protein [Candidatus Bipolaricaulota bacterium]
VDPRPDHVAILSSPGPLHNHARAGFQDCLMAFLLPAIRVPNDYHCLGERIVAVPWHLFATSTG